MQDRKPAKPLSFEELKHKYQVEKLSVEQLYGQVLVWIEIVHDIAVANQRNQEGYDVELADLVAQVAELKEKLQEGSK